MAHLDWPDDVRRTTCATPCTDPTHYVCPQRSAVRGQELTHHLKTRAGNDRRRGQEQFCGHCGRSATDLRKETAA